MLEASGGVEILMETCIKYLSYETYRDLCSWLEEFIPPKGTAWTAHPKPFGDKLRKYRFIIMLTRRCFNLCVILLRTQGRMVDSDDDALFADLYSDNSIKLQVKELADFYCDFGEFPEIALVDDLLVHGRALSKFLSSFLFLLTEAIHKEQWVRGTQMESTEELRNAFVAALDIHIFAQNDNVLLIPKEYQRKLKSRNIWSLHQWRQFSYQASYLLWSADIANTSFVLSARLPDGAPGWLKEEQLQTLKKANWRDVNTIYRGKAQQFFIYTDNRVGAEAIEYIAPTIRYYKCEQGVHYLTPYVFTSSLSNNVMRELDSLLRVIYCDQPLFLRQLDRARGHEETTDIYAQTISFLLSFVFLERFVKTLGLRNSQYTFDIEKINLNFKFQGNQGPASKHELENLFQSINLPEDAATRICAFFAVEGRVGKLVLEPTQEIPEFTLPLREAIADVVYEEAINSAVVAEESIQATRQGYDLDIDGKNRRSETKLSEILTKALSRSEQFDLAKALSTVTQMMDAGDVSLKLRGEPDLGACTVLRSAEMSLAIYPRLLQLYFFALNKMARLSHTKERFLLQVTLFFDFLQQNRDEIFTDELACEKKQLESKRKQALRFADLLYKDESVKATMLSWDIYYFYTMDVLPEHIPTTMNIKNYVNQYFFQQAELVKNIYA